MFSSNTIVGKREFANDPPGTLRVTSVFFTLQGEGPLSGQPSVFVRLAKCNLNCSFCDTYFETGELYTFDELDLLIQRRIMHFFGTSFPHYAQWLPAKSRGINLVITGGEPLLQDNLLDYFYWLSVQAERIDGYTAPQFQRIQIETNGILRWRGPSDVLLVVSPKAVQDRDGHPLHHIQPHHSTLAAATCLKFVISAPLPGDERPQPYSMVPDWALAWSHETGCPIYVSPMAHYMDEPREALIAIKTGADVSIDVRSEALERVSLWDDGVFDKPRTRLNYEYAALLAMRHGYILSTQTHLMASLP